MEKPKIIIADDHTLVAEAIKHLLEPGFRVVKIVEDGRCLLAAAKELAPAVILLDLNMPHLNGIDAGKELKQIVPRTKLIVLTMNEDAAIAYNAIRQWASGYLLKKSAGIELRTAISEVLQGRTYITPHIADKMTHEFSRGPEADRERRLTQRQREVLQLLAEGRSMKEAADILNITARTVAFHKYRMMEEFHIQTNADLVRFALREHLIFSETAL